jgi:hypothetical protein
MSPPEISNTSTSSVEDSLARISQSRENRLGLPMPMERQLALAFGLSSPALFGTYDPDGSCWRMSQASLFQEQCPELLQTWPDSGMWDAGGVYELQTSEPVTSGNESSLWPTATASEGGTNKSLYETAQPRPQLATMARNWPTARQEDGESCGNHPGSVDSLTGATALWRTPDVPGSGGPRNRQDSIGEGHQTTIAEQAEHWLTPHGMGNRDKSGKLGESGGGEFGKQANRWSSSGTGSAADASESGTPLPMTGESLPLFPALDAEPTNLPSCEASSESLWGTPTQRDWKDGSCETADVPTNSLLGREVVRWQTPTQGDSKGRTYQYDQHDKTKPRLSLEGVARAFPDSPQDQQIPDGPQSSGKDPTSRRPSQRILPHARLRELWRVNGSIVFRGGDGDDSASNSLLESLWLSLRESRGRRRLGPRFVSWLMGFHPRHTETMSASRTSSPGNGSED